MIKPPPFYFECPKCKFQEKHQPRSDNLQPDDKLRFCPKCKIVMKEIDEEDYKPPSFVKKLFK